MATVGCHFALVFVCASLSLSPLSAQPLSTSASPVVGDLLLPSGEVVRFRLAAGSLLRISGSGDVESGYGLLVDDSDASDMSTFSLLEMDLDGRAYVSIVENGDARLAPEGLASGSRLERRVAADIVLSSNVFEEFFGDSSLEFCCVTCGSTTVCADAVSRSCGSCGDENRE